MSVSLQVRCFFEVQNSFTAKKTFLLVLNNFISIFRVEIGLENEKKKKEKEKKRRLAKKK